MFLFVFLAIWYVKTKSTNPLVLSYTFEEHSSADVAEWLVKLVYINIFFTSIVSYFILLLRNGHFVFVTYSSLYFIPTSRDGANLNVWIQCNEPSVETSLYLLKTSPFITLYKTETWI